MLKRITRAVFPAKGDGKAETLRKIACIVLFAIVVVCAVLILSDTFRSLRNQRLNSSLAAKYVSTPSSSDSAVSKNYPAGMLGTFDALYDQNPDVKGFLEIPNSVVKYPVAQSSDNEYYLKKDFTKADNSHGTLFLDYRDRIKPLSQNLIIYGHNMHDGQMFHSILNYQNTDTYNAAPVITFNTLYENDSWKIFACFIANCDPKDGYVFNYLITDFSSDEEFASFIKEVKARSLLNTQVDVKPGDTLLTLSTCTYPKGLDNARFVLMARRVRTGENPSVAPASRNKSALSATSPMQ